IKVILESACTDPCRSLNGQTVDLGQRFSYYRKLLANRGDVSTDEPNSDWQLIYGKVFQIDGDGFLFHSHGIGDIGMRKEPELIHVRNHPEAHSATDDSVLAFLAVPCGRFSYINTQGARKSVPDYDYGSPCSTNQLATVLKRMVDEAKAPPPETWKPRVRAI